MLEGNTGKIITKKNGKTIQDRTITKKEFKKYLKAKNLKIGDNIISNAINMFNTLLLPQLENSKLVIKDLENKDIKIVGLKNKQLGLNRDEISYINKNLNKRDLIKFMQQRYNVKDSIFKNMTKKQILEDLKFPKNNLTNQDGGYFDQNEPQAGFNGDLSNLKQKTLDFSFPEIIKNN